MLRLIDPLKLGSQRKGVIVKRHLSSCFSSAAFATVAQVSSMTVTRTVVMIRGTLCNNQSLFIVFFSFRDSIVDVIHSWTSVTQGNRLTHDVILNHRSMSISMSPIFSRAYRKFSTQLTRRRSFGGSAMPTQTGKPNALPSIHDLTSRLKPKVASLKNRIDIPYFQ